MTLHRPFLCILPILFLVTGASIPAAAQSLCDLVPPATVKSTLGITVSLTATPNTEGGNGCDYKGASTGPITIRADALSDTGIYKTIFDQRLRKLGPSEQLVAGIGDAAYYDLKQDQQIPKYQGVNFTQQAIVFRAKGKIVNFILMIPGDGVPKASMLALANFAISKPIDTLKDPQ
jgi:hypothetical protein